MTFTASSFVHILRLRLRFTLRAVPCGCSPRCRILPQRTLRLPALLPATYLRLRLPALFGSRVAAFRVVPRCVWLHALRLPVVATHARCLRTHALRFCIATLPGYCRVLQHQVTHGCPVTVTPHTFTVYTTRCGYVPTPLPHTHGCCGFMPHTAHTLFTDALYHAVTGWVAVGYILLPTYLHTFTDTRLLHGSTTPVLRTRSRLPTFGWVLAWLVTHTHLPHTLHTLLHHTVCRTHVAARFAVYALCGYLPTLLRLQLPRCITTFATRSWFGCVGCYARCYTLHRLVCVWLYAFGSGLRAPVAVLYLRSGYHCITYGYYYVRACVHTYVGLPHIHATAHTRVWIHGLRCTTHAFTHHGLVRVCRTLPVLQHHAPRRAWLRFGCTAFAVTHTRLHTRVCLPPDYCLPGYVPTTVHRPVTTAYRGCAHCLHLVAVHGLLRCRLPVACYTTVYTLCRFTYTFHAVYTRCTVYARCHTTGLRCPPVAWLPFGLPAYVSAGTHARFVTVLYCAVLLRSHAVTGWFTRLFAHLPGCRLVYRFPTRGYATHTRCRLYRFTRYGSCRSRRHTRWLRFGYRLFYLPAA